MTDKVCFCDDGKHRKIWHAKIHKAGVNFTADFPFEKPPTFGTGLWTRDEMHKIKNWGKTK